MIADSPDIEIKDEDKEKVYDDLDFAEETQATKQIVLTSSRSATSIIAVICHVILLFKFFFLHVNTVYY